MGNPGGGPEDKTQPEVTGSNPAPGSTLVSPRSKIEIFFSEPVDPATLEASLFISPTQTERPKVKVHGRRAVITLPDSIPSYGALTATIGAGVKDLHGNTLKSSFSIAITAGDRIPTGNIAGRIYSDGAISGLIVGAWTSHNREAVRPDTLLAPYLTQCDVNGYFKFEYLPDGNYRVLAWGDRDGDRKYAPGTDLLALPAADLNVLADSIATLSLWASKRDTTEAIPAYASASDQRHLAVRFTRAPGIRLQHVLANATIKDSLGYGLQVFSSWVDPVDSTKLIFFTAIQDSVAKYTVSFQGDTTELPFNGSTSPDTLRLKLSTSTPKANSRDANPRPEGDLAFDDALMAVPPDSAIILMKSDSLKVPLEFIWEAPNRLRWKAAEEVGTGVQCKLNVNLALFKDRSGNIGADSIFSIAFETSDPTSLGSISGHILNGDGRNDWVAAKPLEGVKKTPKTAHSASDGAYEIVGLEPGRYVLWTWSDRSKDARLTLGTLTPFKFAEPFAFLPDTLTVRARWQNGSVDLKLP